MTDYNKSLSGLIDPTGTVTPLRRKNISGQLNPTGTVARRKYLHASASGTITPTGDLAVVHYHMSYTRSLSAFVTPTGSVSAKKVTSASGGITPAGTLSKRVLRSLTATIAPAGNVLQGQLEYLSATITPIGSVALLWLKSLEGRIESLGDITGELNGGVVSKTGLISPFGTLTYKKLLALTGTINPAGTVAPAKRVASVAIGGTVSMVSVLTTVPLYTDVDVSTMNTAVQYDLLIEQGSAFYRRFRWLKKDGVPFDLSDFALRMTIRPTKGDSTLYASSDTGGTITIGKLSNGIFTVTMLSAYTASLNFTRAVYEITASWSSAGNTVRTRLIEGNITLSKAVTPTIRYTDAEVGCVQPAGSLSTQRGHASVGTMSPWGALSSIAAFRRSLSGTVTPAGTLRSVILVNLSGSISPTGTTVPDVLNDLEGTIEPEGAVEYIVAYTLALSGTITPTGGS